MRPSFVLPVLMASVLAGCATTVTRYYTLSTTAGEAAEAKRTEGAPALVGIGPVQLPDYIDRPQIVLRTSDHTVEQAVFDQWGGSLGDMLQRVLVENMGSRLPRDNFVAFPQSGDLPFDYRVPVTVSRFDVSTSGEAVLIARWQVRGKAGSGTLVVRETVARTQADGKSYQDRVGALSKAIGALTDQIAAALASMPRARAAR